MQRIQQLFSFNSQEPLIFTQLDFWLFFILVMVIFSAIHKHFLVRSIFLTVISLFFYFKTSGLFVLLLGLTLVVNFAFGIRVQEAEKDRSKKLYIAASVIFNLLLLGYFKYAYFFTDSFNQLFHTNYQIVNQFALWGNGFFGEGTFVDKILIPIGVSFFTFHNISYVVDIYRKEIKVTSFYDFTFYVTYFPHLVAGPIVRARDFIPQINQPFTLTKQDFSWSLVQITKGLFKKIVLADYIAVHFIDKIADAPESYPGFVSVLAMWAYSLQIYGDFSGYTDIAIGISRLMGFNLLENFNSPYKAVSVADFWRRWHKSLGSWLRDYLYIPLGGNRSGGIGTYIASTIIFVFLIFITQWYELIFVYVGLMLLYLFCWNYFPKLKDYLNRDLNLLITMVVGGLWHGASENFIIWGSMNGLALIIYQYWKKISPYEQSSSWGIRAWRIFFTFNFITFTRIWFRLDEAGEPLKMLEHIWTNFDFTWPIFVKVLDTYQAVFWLILIGFVLHWLPESWKEKGIHLFAKVPFVFQAVLIAFSVFFMYQAISDTFKPFVYFQF
jgi:D-alanyl-lipoteichoic acid acyltransferase DltB (MBOAT superfamily)